jgi:hypothetical protein
MNGDGRRVNRLREREYITAFDTPQGASDWQLIEFRRPLLLGQVTLPRRRVKPEALPQDELFPAGRWAVEQPWLLDHT